MKVILSALLLGCLLGCATRATRHAIELETLTRAQLQSDLEDNTMLIANSVAERNDTERQRLEDIQQDIQTALARTEGKLDGLEIKATEERRESASLYINQAGGITGMLTKMLGGFHPAVGAVGGILTTILAAVGGAMATKKGAIA